MYTEKYGKIQGKNVLSLSCKKVLLRYKIIFKLIINWR